MPFQLASLNLRQLQVDGPVLSLGSRSLKLHVEVQQSLRFLAGGRRLFLHVLMLVAQVVNLTALVSLSAYAIQAIRRADLCSACTKSLNCPMVLSISRTTLSSSSARSRSSRN